MPVEPVCAACPAVCVAVVSVYLCPGSQCLVAWATPTCATGACPRPCRRASAAAPAWSGATGWRGSARLSIVPAARRTQQRDVTISKQNLELSAMKDELVDVKALCAPCPGQIKELKEHIVRLDKEPSMEIEVEEELDKRLAAE